MVSNWCQILKRVELKCLQTPLLCMLKKMSEKYSKKVLYFLEKFAIINTSINYHEGRTMLFSEKQINPMEYSPLAVAYIGDTVFDLFIRTKIVEQGRRKVTDMHKMAVGMVNAGAQAKIVHIIEEDLTEEELGILKWGRNAKFNTKPSHASVGDYHLATGLETLVGWLYIRREENRLRELLEKAYANFNKE